MAKSKMDEGTDSEDEEYEIAAHDIVPEYTLNEGNYGMKVAPNASKKNTAKKMVAKALKMQRHN